MVWDVTSNEQYSYPLGVDPVTTDWYHPDIVSSHTGWLLKDLYGEQAPAFIYCDKILTSCTPYSFENTAWVAVSPDVDIIITEDLNALGIWKRGENGDYTLTDNSVSSNEFCPSWFSPSGKYVFSRCGKPPVTIWDVASLKVVHRTSNPNRPYWLADENYFVTIRPDAWLNLFRLGQTQPIEQLNFWTVNKLRLPGDISGDMVEIRTVSEDGQWIFINLDGTEVLVPVIYPQ
jgi:WD40 repeat protein